MNKPFLRINLLGVEVDTVNLEQASSIVIKWLKTGGKHYVVTPNIEFLMLAQKDKEFKGILHKADLSIPDSGRFSWLYDQLKEKNQFKRLLKWPLFLAPFLLKDRLIPTTTGTDLTGNLISKSAEKGFTIGFLGGTDNLALILAERLKEKYPKLKIGLAESNILVDREGNIIKGGEKLNNLELPIDILFVALGQGKQERWIKQNLTKLPVKVMIGVGGAFDYLTNSVLRAPKLMRQLGLEWLFRVIIQPWRLKRFLALFKFVFWVLFISKKAS